MKSCVYLLKIKKICIKLNCLLFTNYINSSVLKVWSRLFLELLRDKIECL